ncbi:MAG: DNA polymerase-3 subunit beta [Glaciecola sp.]|jgi:DNA polymerase-3 subunit beta
MKVICNREKLRDALSIASQLVPTKTTNPVLENVCLVATDHALEFLATDQEVSLRYTIDDVKVGETGVVVIPAKVAMEVVRDLSGEDCQIEMVGTRCRLSSNQDHCDLVTADPDEFPVIPRFEAKEHISIQGGVLTKLVSQTSFAAAREPGRYAMHGIQTSLQGDNLQMVATDGRRLARVSTPVDSQGVVCDPLIVPTRGMQLFSRVISDPLDQVHLEFSSDRIGLKTRGAQVFTRVIEGQFPIYDALFPEEHMFEVEVDKGVFGQKLRLAASVGQEQGVRMQLTEGRLNLFVRSISRGEAEASMDVDYHGEDAEIAFRPDFVLDGIKRCESDTVTLRFNGSSSPGEFLLGGNYRYVVMPVTIDTRPVAAATS